ncbi:MAG: peptidylprolyl isomerase [Akkermansiaceae bacterium]|nr:peptidylprolyl isomerase [Akkermansiaceae bacterium]
MRPLFKPVVALSLLVVALVVISRFIPDHLIQKSLRLWHSNEKVAQVFGQSISRSQLERAVREQLWAHGKSLESLTKTELTASMNSALDDLVDHAVLIHEVSAMQPPLILTDHELAERISRFTHRFENKSALDAAMSAQGIANPKALADHIASQIRQEKFVEARIAPIIQVTRKEARSWYDANPDSITIPERIEVRHLFIPTLDHPPETARQTLATALEKLSKGSANFAQLAREVSEDPATQNSGGELGWMTRDRLPTDLSQAVFLLNLHQPTLLESRLGWHLIELTGRKPAEARSFDQALPEILAALETIKRQNATSELRKSLRQSASPMIKIHPAALASFAQEILYD